ncbi:hypothetical protein SEA_FUNSIZED_81 [Mycobacterium phage Funsized]|nr:hypothetical protein SEA_FUNSIZED_81 [Mycobacterium phage Funsized]
MDTVEVVLWGGPLDGQPRVVPATLSALTIAQYAAPANPWDQPEGDVPVVKHRYVRSATQHGRFNYDGTVE